MSRGEVLLLAAGLGAPLLSYLGGVGKQSWRTPLAAGAVMALAYGVLAAVARDAAHPVLAALLLAAASFGACAVPYVAGRSVARHPVAVAIVGILILFAISWGVFASLIVAGLLL